MVLPLNPMGAFSPVQSIPARADLAPAAPVPPTAGVRQQGANTPETGVSQTNLNRSANAPLGWGGFQAVLAEVTGASSAPPVRPDTPVSGWVPPAQAEQAPASRIIGYSALSRAAPEASPAGQMVSALA